MLDVATGTGGFIAELRSQLNESLHNSNTKIVGVDQIRYAFLHLREADERENVYYLPMNAACLGFPDSSFDLVCLVRALHHMTDNTQPQALAEMHRVLKPGGRFFVAEMYRDGQTEAQMTDVLLHHWTAALETATRPPPSRWVHRETFTRSEVIRMVQGVPLRNLQLHDIASLGPDDDPLNPGRINYQEFCLDRSLRYLSNRPEPVPGNAALRDRAEVLRQRLHTVGINSATLLVAVGIK